MAIIDKEALYAFVYEHNCDAWLCTSFESHVLEASLRSFILKLHTGESVNQNTWSMRQRADYGQARLVELATAAMAADDQAISPHDRPLLLARLELDGYAFRNGALLPTEGETQDVEAERGELEQLYVDLGLPNLAIVKDCLEKSEDYYARGNYRDCIGNARHYEEQILEDVARAWSQRPNMPQLVIGPNQAPAGPCRNYLEANGLLSTDERDTFRHLHGLLSNTGGHPNLSEKDEARVFRRLATSMAFYVLLRYQAAR